MNNQEKRMKRVVDLIREELVEQLLNTNKTTDITMWLERSVLDQILNNIKDEVLGV